MVMIWQTLLSTEWLKNLPEHIYCYADKPSISIDADEDCMILIGTKWRA